MLQRLVDVSLPTIATKSSETSCYFSTGVGFSKDGVAPAGRPADFVFLPALPLLPAGAGAASAVPGGRLRTAFTLMGSSYGIH